MFYFNLKAKLGNKTKIKNVIRPCKLGDLCALQCSSHSSHQAKLCPDNVLLLLMNLMV